MRSLVLAAMLVASAANAQTMYKCSNVGRIEYSDKPCLTGDVVKRIAPEGGPTPEDRARAQMRQNAERARFEAQDRAAAASRASQAYAGAARVHSGGDDSNLRNARRREGHDARSRRLGSEDKGAS